jgi:cytosine/adenosine deaminase-related metal-dependent hydrolase
VVPVASPIISDGAVLMDGEIILDVGTTREICLRHPHIAVSHCDGVLFPALINAHTHLELAVYGPVAPKSPDSSMCEWITSLLCLREEAGYSKAEVQAAAAEAAREQYESGVGLLLDTGNVGLEPFENSSIEIISLLEMLGPSKAAEASAIIAIDFLSKDIAITGHAPYSTSPGLLRHIKKRSLAQNDIFSIHLAENSDEALLLTKAQGCFVKFLKDRNGFDGSFPIPGIDTSCVLSYLDELGILDRGTLCVHCVHLSHKDIEILAQSKTHVCLCPGSNRFLSVGVAPLEQLLESGILPALGTDSISSNPVPDIWEEMTLLRSQHLAVSDENIIKIATLGGAVALHREEHYGTISKGRRARILLIQDPKYVGAQNGSQLLERITSCGRPEKVEWIYVKEE